MLFSLSMTVDRTLMIEDWALGALYWNCLKKAHGDKKLPV